MTLAELRRLGLKVTAVGERLDVQPRALITDELRALIRLTKAALLRELAEEMQPRAMFPAWTRLRYGERRGRRRVPPLARVHLARH